MKTILTAAVVTLTIATSAAAFGTNPIPSFPTLWPQPGVFEDNAAPKLRGSK